MTQDIVLSEVRNDELSIESHVAALWWMDQLANPDPDDAGDPILDAMTALAKQKKLPQLSTLQLMAFYSALGEIVEHKFVKSDHWRPQQPHWGSANRYLATDYHMCVELKTAYEYALGGVDYQGICPFPIKTVMWVSPGDVKVRCGYLGKEVPLLTTGGTDDST